MKMKEIFSVRSHEIGRRMTTERRRRRRGHDEGRVFKLVQASKPPNSSAAKIETNLTTSYLSRNGQQQSPTSNNNNNERINLIEADQYGLYLVGLFDIHNSNPRVPFKCGSIDVDVGEWHSRRPMQNMEAFLWAIEQVNADKSLLPGVRLGSLVMDTCSSFLRTNQQLANLLHGSAAGSGPPHPVSGGKVTSNRQIAAIVADNSDWQSVEAVVSMASAQGLTTFVTQSRSSKLSELARKYNNNNSHLDLNPNLRPLSSASDQDSSTMMMMNPEQFKRRSSAAAASPLAPPLDGLLSELLGIGKMTSPRPKATELGAEEVLESASEVEQQQQQQHKLYMVRMLLGNELLADAIGSLAQQMNWDLVSVIYDDEPDLVDLHDELIKQLFQRNIQLALDEQINAAVGATETYDKLLVNLAKKSQFGSRVVITLLGTGSARLLLDSLHHLRNSINSNQQQVNQVNSLLWITVTDREPYYSFATDSLGSIAISSSVSLIPEFRNYYDKLANEPHGQVNRWWPEYMKAILLKHQRDIELISNECARWQEPKVSPLNEKCRSLTLSSLVQLTSSSTTAAAASSNFSNLAISSTAPAAKSRLMNAAGTSQQHQQAKLTKYLANGWEHNGMDIINSVLAVANGLESVRQTLCPNLQSGICDRMRELITSSTSQQQQRQEIKLPLLSELIYNELLRSTFQLADGRMFNLDDFNSPIGQVEGKFKLYNLRYLQQNSIGFVKFGQFDQVDGLELNTTKARHYHNMGFSDQEPIEMVKSTCEDENKCLMFGALGALNKQHQAGGGGFSEEELAAGVNSLFKLDHPLFHQTNTAAAESIQQQQQQNSGDNQLPASATMQTVASATGNGGGSSSSVSGRLNQATSATQLLDSAQVETMLSNTQELSMSLFNSTIAEGLEQHLGVVGGKKNELLPKMQTFNTIVLLPLHNKGYQSSSSSSSSCSEHLDLEHSFQLLVALAYAQQSVNGALEHSSTASIGNNNGNNNNNNNNDDDVFLPHNSNANNIKPQIELTTTVIDYCNQAELAKTKLLTKLAADSSSGIHHQSAEYSQRTGMRFPGKTVAIIDFDAQISENIDNLLEDKQLLHLTIGPAALNHSPQNSKHQLTTIDAAAAAAPKEGEGEVSNKNRNRKHNHLKLSLMPSKSNEIQALVKLISSMPQWRLVHLIYTDHHHYRDEFVRRANEANICVSKLIWIPTIAPSVVPTNNGSSGATLAANADNAAAAENAGTGTGAGSGEKGRDVRQIIQLEKTRALFARELYDYSNPGRTVAKGNNSSSTGNNNNNNNNKQTLDPSGAQGLNSTRILVVLASSSDLTNQMILEAASDSMLEDYVWITSHEWLKSVELPAEQAKDELIKLPKHYLSTRLETYESHGFRRYLSTLNPLQHSPVPATWFYEFWQQHFRCRIASTSNQQQFIRFENLPKCNLHHQKHLDTTVQHMIEDDRVHYVIEAIESMHEALGRSLSKKSTFNSAELSLQLRLALEKRRQLGSELSPKISQLPYGFHIVHRLLPAANGSSLGRRANSRDLSQVERAQLLRVGLWRDGQLILLNKKSLSLSTTNETLEGNHWWLNSRASGLLDSSGMMDQDNVVGSISKSLTKLNSIKSRCQANSQTCTLCRQQVEQTMSIIKQEEARLGQSEFVSEPNAFSSIWWHKKQADLPNYSTFDDDETNEEEEDNETSANEEDLKSSSKATDIQAAASSLFDGTVSKQVADRQRESDMRRLYGGHTHMTKLQQGRWLSSSDTGAPINLNFRQAPALLTSMVSLVGVVIMVASMTYLYPNMLERTIKRNDIGIGGAILGVEQQLGTKPDGGDGSITTSATTHSSLSNINDYFLLTGLLMLYSINMAFLLPATMGVCWFRRIGLATSYTVIFSSILVKVLNSCRQSSRQQRRQNNQAQQSQQHQVTTDTFLEDSVEVTFESLTQDQNMMCSVVEEDQTPNCSTIDHLTNGYQTTNSNGALPVQQQHHQQDKLSQVNNIWSQHWYTSRDPATLLTISICLILCQVVVSLVWFIQQPPEPTLYLNCWRCASPIRSPILFLYEPLLSLLYPGLILVLSWSLSVIAYRMASENEEQYRLASRRLLNGGTILTNQDNQLKIKQRQLDYKLRDARALVLCSSLTVFVWSLMTLQMISSSHNKLMPLSNSASQSTTNSHQHSIYSINQTESTKTMDDLSLVYANIFSGAIIFSFLFIYRLHLFKWPSTSSGYSSTRNNKLLGRKSPFNRFGANNAQVLKYNQAADMQARQQNKWFGGGEDIFPVPAGDSFFTGSQFSTASSGRHERLKLQQFNSSYGTYSAAGIAPTENYHTSTTINPLHTIGIGATSNANNNNSNNKIDPSTGFSIEDSSSVHKGSLKRRQKASATSLFSSPFGGSKKKKPPVPKPRVTGANGPSTSNGNGNQPEFRLQRRQSSGSVASSTAKLVGDNSSMDNDMFMDDTISCASSVASSSTSQLHGNDLYPIDCSIQLDSQLPNNNSFIGPSLDGSQALNRSGSFNRRSSLRRSMNQGNKLSSVREEQVVSSVDKQQQQQLSLDSGTATTVADLSEEIIKTP